MNDKDIIKVELSEENLIKPKRIEFKNGSVIEIPIDASEATQRSNNRIVFWD